MSQFLAYVEELTSLPPEPELVPNIDERDEKEERELRESEDLARGAILRGTVKEGEGDSPKEGDLVLVHYIIQTLDGDVLESTRTEAGGPGQPRPFVLGKGCRAPRAWELALYDMKKGERAVLRVKPEYGYAHRDCGFQPPKGLPGKDICVFDLELCHFYAKDSVRVIAQGAVFKKILADADSWENPRPLYEVEFACCIRTASSSGVLGEGDIMFRSSADQPLNVAIGDASLPKGMEECVCSMTRDESSVFLVPTNLMEGGSVCPPMPSNHQWVECEIQLLKVVQVRDLTGQGDLLKRRLREGEGEFPMDCPLEDSRVRLHYRARAAASTSWVIDTRGQDGSQPPLEFDTGMGVVPEAVDMCVRLMLPGELCVVHSAARYAFEGRSDTPAGINPEQKVEFEVELIDFEKMPAWVEMAAEDKLQQATVLKDQGNAMFKQGQYKFAESKYVKAHKVLTSINNPESVQQVNRISAAKVSVLTNLAMVAHKTTQYGTAIDWCNRAIKEDPDQPKPYFRRAVAHSYLGRYEEAAADLALVVELDPSLQSEVDKELRGMEERLKRADKKQRKELANFLNKATAS